MKHSKENDNGKKTILVTGVTGYVGGRLVARLLDHGYKVRVMVRGGAARLEGRPWKEHVEIAVSDVFDVDNLRRALQGVDAAYYLIHSMSKNVEFSERDIQAAENFSKISAECEVRQIIYLGGLGQSDGSLSEHLRSRQETGAALRKYGVPVTEFRAGMVVGSGSLSFEMMRHLTERLPAMITPRWVNTQTQPIAIRDVLNYLVTALEVPESADEVIEIGGADVLTYADMMQIYGSIRGLTRVMVPIPILSPRLSSYWAHWVTPISANVARPLIEGLRNETLVVSKRAEEIFPEIKPMDFETAVRRALMRIDKGDIETLWSDALVSSQGDVKPVYLTQEQGMLIERRQQTLKIAPEIVFRAFCGLGGERGWPPYTWLWRLRGAVDRMIGGVGMRRGRRHPDELLQGEALDFWRIERLEPGRLLRLRAEMKLPGDGWLQFEALPREDGGTELIQTAYFASRGLFGFLYWYGVYPVHGPVFSGMIEWVVERARMLAAEAA